MARTNMFTTRVKPESTGLLTLHVLRRERISPNFARVTLGGGDIDRFSYMGFDHWFRLFIPVAEGSLARLPQKLDTLDYLKYLAISKTERPVLRNYTVRDYRAEGPDGPELDVDFVLHGTAAAGTAGPAASWAESCAPGDPVALLDEGITFNPDPSLRRVLLVADETGLPAVAGILSSLPEEIDGRALIEVASEDDQQAIDAPAGFPVTWIVRTDAAATPGRAVLAAASALPVSEEPFYAWAVGEQTMPTALRRHWINSGVPKQNIGFSGYWKAARH